MGLLIYSLGIHPIIKWPLILFSVGLGAALAFLPFEERPLEKWIVAFFRSVYSPTIFAWRQTTTAPVFFQPETAAVDGQVKSSEPKASFMNKLEETEAAFLTKVTTLFVAAPSGAGTQKSTTTPVMTIPVSNPLIATIPMATVQPVSPTVSRDKPEVFIPAINRVAISANPMQPKVVVEETSAPVQILQQNVAPAIFEAPSTSSAQAQFSADAAPPTPPTTPNTIVGQVMDPDGKIVESAILEIRDSMGRPVRALKTNKAGHFLIVTPLPNGTYELLAEKEGLIFAALKFEAHGDIIPPMAVRASSRQMATQEITT